MDAPAEVVSVRASGLRSPVVGIVAALLWGLGLVVGICLLGRYEATPGHNAPLARSVPVGFPVELRTDGPTLVMFVHPRCPCTRASVAELERLLARHPEMRAHVLFFTPSTADAEWRQSALRESVNAMEHVVDQEDVDGAAARGAGVETSGTTLVIAPDGRVVFRGGLTAGRGHQGDNESTDAIEGALAAMPREAVETPAYGCAIVSAERCEQCSGVGHDE